MAIRWVRPLVLLVLVACGSAAPGGATAGATTGTSTGSDTANATTGVTTGATTGTTEPTPPTAAAVAPANVVVGDEFTISSAGSIPSSLGGALTFAWTLPAELEFVAADGATQAEPMVRALTAGTVTVSLTVTSDALTGDTTAPVKVWAPGALQTGGRGIGASGGSVVVTSNGGGIFNSFDAPAPPLASANRVVITDAALDPNELTITVDVVCRIAKGLTATGPCDESSMTPVDVVELAFTTGRQRVLLDLTTIPGEPALLVTGYLNLSGWPQSDVNVLSVNTSKWIVLNGPVSTSKPLVGAGMVFTAAQGLWAFGTLSSGFIGDAGDISLSSTSGPLVVAGANTMVNDLSSGDAGAIQLQTDGAIYLPALRTISTNNNGGQSGDITITAADTHAASVGVQLAKVTLSSAARSPANWPTNGGAITVHATRSDGASVPEIRLGQAGSTSVDASGSLGSTSDDGGDAGDIEIRITNGGIAAATPSTAPRIFGAGDVIATGGDGMNGGAAGGIDIEAQANPSDSGTATVEWLGSIAANGGNALINAGEAGIPPPGFLQTISIIAGANPGAALTGYGARIFIDGSVSRRPGAGNEPLPLPVNGHRCATTDDAGRIQIQSRAAPLALALPAQQASSITVTGSIRLDGGKDTHTDVASPAPNGTGVDAGGWLQLLANDGASTTIEIGTHGMTAAAIDMSGGNAGAGANGVAGSGCRMQIETKATTNNIATGHHELIMHGAIKAIGGTGAGAIGGGKGGGISMSTGLSPGDVDWPPTELTLEGNLDVRGGSFTASSGNGAGGDAGGINLTVKGEPLSMVAQSFIALGGGASPVNSTTRSGGDGGPINFLTYSEGASAVTVLDADARGGGVFTRSAGVTAAGTGGAGGDISVKAFGPFSGRNFLSSGGNGCNTGGVAGPAGDITLTGYSLTGVPGEATFVFDELHADGGDLNASGSASQPTPNGTPGVGGDISIAPTSIGVAITAKVMSVEGGEDSTDGGNGGSITFTNGGAFSSITVDSIDASSGSPDGAGQGGTTTNQSATAVLYCTRDLTGPVTVSGTFSLNPACL